MFDAVRAAFHDPDTRQYQVLNTGIWAMIVLSILLVAAELLQPRGPDSPLEIVDTVIVVVFSLELILRILTFQPPEVQFYVKSRAATVRAEVLGRVRYFFTSPRNLIDFVCVMEVLHPAFRGLRAARALRLFRGLGIFRYNSPMVALERALVDNLALYVGAFGLLFAGVLVGGIAIFMTNAGANPLIRNVWDGMWWALVTITTVGYGDISPDPDDSVGRAVAAALMVFGMVMLALFAGIISNSLLSSVLALRLEQFRMTNTYRHIVVCGYNEGARMLLDVLEDEVDPSKREVVIFGKGERPASIPHEYRWVEGDPTKESELDKARIPEASAVIVVGERQMLPQSADAQTILTAFTIRRYMKKRASVASRSQPLYIVAEVLDHENVEHAFAAGCDEVIETTRLGFSLISHAIAHPGTGALLGMLATNDGQNLYVGTIPEELPPGAVFLQAVKHLADRGILVVGLRIVEGRDQLNPPPETPLSGAAGLIYIAARPSLPRLIV